MKDDNLVKDNSYIGQSTNMPTKQNNWEEYFRLKLKNVYATVFQLSGFDEKQLKEKEDIMVEFIKDLRKKDEEELIKSLGEQYGGEHFMSVIKDYYNLIK